MVTLGFGYSLLDDETGIFSRKFYAFSVPDMTSDQFDDLDQAFDHPDRDEWDCVFDEAGSTATIDCCDFFSTEKTPPDTFLWADYNVIVPEKKIIRGCEILRNFFIGKGMACSAISEFSEY